MAFEIAVVSLVALGAYLAGEDIRATAGVP